MKLRIFFCYGGYKVQKKVVVFFVSRKEYTKVIYHKVIACILTKIMLPYTKYVLSFNFKKGIIIKLLL